MNRHKLRNTAGGAMLCLGAFAAGCGSDNETGTGSLTVLLESEDLVVEGLEPGDDRENIADGWAVKFDKYLATIGDINVRLATDSHVEAEAHDVFVVDLTQVPAAGLSLWTIEDLQVGRWEFNFATPGAGDGSARHGSVDEDDYDEMVDRDWTYLIEGLMMKSDGQSCPPAALANPGSEAPNGNMSGDNECYDAKTVRFVFGATAETRFGPCEIDEVPGFPISADGAQTVAATLHGDHPFFNGFPEGDEGGVTRLAQWLADCDLNLDGTITQDELEAIAPSQLPEFDDRFQLGGSPITPLESMYDYLASQLKTQGHFQGEGECPIDGTEHDHGHDH
ncbi:MAG: hypothetical protein OXU20_26670 [Myxococcales bacterium]|nr:hypothetical protein [Myxococcales bacterium]MDD9971385.1 hypothetical protein [Myxococcales bacterium]